MKRIKQISFLLLLVSLIISCTSTKKIQKNLNANSYSMAYLMDTEVADLKKDIKVSIDSIYFNPSIMSDTTKVIRKKGWFIPLVFVYIWNSQNNCIQGKSMIEEEIPSFLKKSMIEEIYRSGSFSVDTNDKSNYTLELSIDEIGARGPYLSSGFFYFVLYVYGYSHSDRAGPAVSNLSISYKLKKDNEVILSNSFDSESTTEQINKRYTNINILQQDYAISMVEATSYNFKNIIELIVNDLNTYFTDK